MAKLWVIILILISILSAKQEYSKKHFLFCLKNGSTRLQFNGLAKSTIVNYPQMNQIIQESGIISIEKWLRGATDYDTVDGVNLSLVYEATFKSDKEPEEIEDVMQKFRALNEVHSAELQPIFRLFERQSAFIPSDTYFDRQWYLKKIKADEAWALWGDQIPGSPDILIGIVDTGVDYLHPDLKEAMYINPGEDINGDVLITAIDSNGVDDDHNGYIDDFMGWDFTGGGDNNVRPPNAGPTLDMSHGTHVAGIAAATTDNGIGIAGISFRSKIIATKHANDDDTSEPSIIDGYDGIFYCAQMGASIINCSWGGGDNFYGKLILRDVVDNYGSIVVCAAGNDDTDQADEIQYPSGYDKSIAVAATNSADKKAYYSNYGNIIDISAPGGEGSSYTNAIYSTVHANAGSYAAFQGTSMASPVAAGCFALLKAWFPDSSADWLAQRLINSADNIDDLNPDYAGKLGSGRVDIYNAIAKNIFPSLSLAQTFTDIIDDNQNGDLNPGESLKLSFLIDNLADWQTAENVTAYISSKSSSVILIDSVALLGNIPGGTSASNTDDELIIKIAPNANYQPVEVVVTFEANETTDHPYKYTDSVEVAVSSFQAGFPVMDTGIDVPVALANVSGSVLPELIAIGANNNLYVYQSNGSLLNGFPVDLGGYLTMGPAVADMDNDGNNEIIMALRSGVVKIVKNSGTVELDKATGEQIYGNLSVGNMDSDEEKEIVFGTMSRKIHIMNPDGTEIPGFPMSFDFPIEEGIALADLNNDNKPEFVFGQFNSTLFALTTEGDTLSGFPVSLSSRIKTTPVVLKINNDYKIIVATQDNHLNIISQTGEIESTYNYDAAINSAPALCDLEGNGMVQILFGTENGQLHATNIEGDTLQSFPVQLNGAVKTSPVFADFDDDGKMEIVVTTAVGRVYVLKTDGTFYPGFPAVVNDYLNGSPAVLDIDRDGDLEIACGGGSGLYVIDVQGEKGSGNFWQTYLGSNERTGFYGDAVTSIHDDSHKNTPDQLILYQNYPNPFNPDTRISFFIPDPQNTGEMNLEIYNILGQKVITLFKGKPETGLNSFTWNGRNEKGQIISSGLYFYTLHSKKIYLTRRLLFIK